jgi:hypothetical protein
MHVSTTCQVRRALYVLMLLSGTMSRPPAIWDALAMLS